jgi:hypothetical protein
MSIHDPTFACATPTHPVIALVITGTRSPAPSSPVPDC